MQRYRPVTDAISCLCEDPRCRYYCKLPGVLANKPKFRLVNGAYQLTSESAVWRCPKCNRYPDDAQARAAFLAKRPIGGTVRCSCEIPHTGYYCGVPGILGNRPVLRVVKGKYQIANPSRVWHCPQCNRYQNDEGARAAFLKKKKAELLRAQVQRESKPPLRKPLGLYDKLSQCTGRPLQGGAIDSNRRRH